MFPKQLRRGALVDGRRIVWMGRAMCNGQTGTSVRVQGRDEATFYPDGVRVPGTLPRADLPAGPVGAGRGMRSAGAGWRDGECARDRHSRLIDCLVYA